jgi:hypothetical protein
VALGALVTGKVELSNSTNAVVRRHKDYEGVVLWLEPVDRPVPALPPKRVEMLQKDKLFQPHVVAISLGSTVELPNLDLIFHNAFSNFSGQPLNTPWYAVSVATGQYAIDGVPPGEYQLRLFHERALPENLRFLERRITVPASGLTLPLISISETGFLPAPHLNKYGNEYPPAANDGTYPGAPRQ